MDTYAGIWAYDFTANNTITIQLYDSPGGSLIWENTSLPTDGDGFHFSHYNTLGCYFIQAGNYIKVIDNFTANYKDVVYPTLTITEVNSASAVVTGTSDPSQEVTVYTSDDDEQEVSLSPTADGSGDWTADFTSIGSTAIASSASVEIYDADNDTVRYHSGYNSYDYHQVLGIRPYYDDGAGYDACPGQTIRVKNGWMAQTAGQVQDYIDALSPFTIDLDSVPILETADADLYWGPIIPWTVFYDGSLIDLYSSQFAFDYPALLRVYIPLFPI